MAPTEGMVAKPERRWGCCRGTLSRHLTIMNTSCGLVCATTQSKSFLILTNKTVQENTQTENN